MAGATPAFVGDLRLVGSSEDHYFQVAHQTASRLGYLGIQNASRKTRPPSQTPGAWAGVIAEVGWAGIGIKTSQEKWDKACLLSSQALGAEKRFLCAPAAGLSDHLKGFHLTLDGWWAGRDEDMWKLPKSHSTGDHGEGVWDVSTESWVPLVPTPEAPPLQVTPAPRLAQDLASLLQLFSTPGPPTPLIFTPKRSVCVRMWLR